LICIYSSLLTANDRNWTFLSFAKKHSDVWAVSHDTTDEDLNRSDIDSFVIITAIPMLLLTTGEDPVNTSCYTGATFRLRQMYWEGMDVETG